MSLAQTTLEFPASWSPVWCYSYLCFKLKWDLELQSLCGHSQTSSNLNMMNQAPHLLFSPGSPRKRQNSQPKHIIDGDSGSDIGDNKPSMHWGPGQWAFNLDPWTLSSNYKNIPSHLLNKLIFPLIKWD